MKKILLMAVAAALMCGCEKQIDIIADNEKKVRFSVTGDFTTTIDDTWTRTALASDENVMTDLWVFDYIGDECVQTLHQSQADDTFGQPHISLRFGSHRLYFVASRGTSPSMDADVHTLTWERPSDTFWRKVELEVTGTTDGNRQVTLDRMVARLRVLATDEIPDGLSTITITPSVWYYGLDYLTGEPIYPRTNEARVVTVPASYYGTTGTLSVSVYGFSGASWSTTVDVVAKNQDGTTLGHTVVADVPVERNRSTDMSGMLFGKVGVNSISLNDEWQETTNVNF